MTRGGLERAHDRLQRAVALVEASTHGHDLHRAAQSLEGALRKLYDALDGRGDGDAALLGAVQCLDDAAPQISGELPELQSLLDEARATLRDTPAEGVAVAPRPLRASRQLPELHSVSRESLTPRIRAPLSATDVELAFEPLPTPTSLEALEDHAARARAHIEAHLARVFEAREKPPPDPPTPRGSARFITQWARECFDEIAMLASQRRPLRGDDWRVSRDIEQRMLCALDAFASLGEGAIDALEGLVLDAPAPDPERAYALAFVCGALEGRDTLGMIERIARAHRFDESALTRLGDALRHAPHPELGAWLDGCLDDDEPPFRELGARVLAARGMLGGERLEQLAADRPEIATHALLPMALGHHARLEPALARALDSPLPAFREAGLVALAFQSKREAAARLRSDLDDERHGARAGLLLALVGTRQDAEAWVERALRNPTPASHDAVAVTGHVSAIPRLLALLRHDDTALALAAAAALERITGAGLYAEVDLPPEALDAPDLPTPSTGGFADAPTLDRSMNDPRLAPAEGSPDRLELPDPSHVRWTAHWREHQPRFEPDTRYRRGQPFSAATVHDELAGSGLDFDVRRDAGLELFLLTNEEVGFDVTSFVDAQSAALDAWREPAKQHSLRGRWLQ